MPLGLTLHSQPWICLSPLPRTLRSLCRNILLYCQHVRGAKQPSKTKKDNNELSLLFHFHVAIKCATELSRSQKQLKSLFTSCALTLGAWYFPCREAGPLYNVIAQTLIMSFSSHFNFHLVKWFSND